MKLVITIVGLLFCLLLMSSALQNKEHGYAAGTTERFRTETKEFTATLHALNTELSKITPKDKAQVEKAKAALKTCRLQYKRIEFFMEYFFDYPISLYNRAPVFEVEEPYMEYQSPIGLQQIEALLFADDVYSNKKLLTDQCDVLETTAADMPAVLYSLTVNDQQVMEALRLEMVRIITLSITGYDAPELKTGIAESAVALTAIQENLAPFIKRHTSATTDSIEKYLSRSIRLTAGHTDFNTFNRLDFLTGAALPLQQYLGIYIKEQNLDLNTHRALNHDAAHIFSNNALDLKSFSDDTSLPANTELAALGKELFYETGLSGNGKRSCATCHQPEKYFTDGLATSRALDEKSNLSRNAPTLYYAAYQRMQFHDGRAASLEAQIKSVLENPREMDADISKVVAWLNKAPKYEMQFRKMYHSTGSDSAVTLARMAAALVAFEQTLAPFSSPFDEYMNGNKMALTAAQQQGFNLFMGKAQCGSCHFAPLFNGLLPPFFERTEIEVLGVPKSGNSRHPKADTDSGRYRFFAISFNNGAFKTSTVRNAAVTAPYMHNGVFKTMKEVIGFYNKGGGAGMHLKIDNQTLSDKPLKLSDKEINQLVAFVEALTDKPLSSIAHP